MFIVSFVKWIYAFTKSRYQQIKLRIAYRLD
jgi:hypothetical protein